MSTELTEGTETAIKESERMLSRVWGLIALRGVVAIVFAAVLLIWPGIGLTAMVWAIGVAAIVSGFVSAAAVSALPRAAKRPRRWLVVHAVIGILGGTAVLLWPGVSATALLYTLALLAITVGVLEFIAAFALPLSGPRTVLVALGGIALTALGILMFVNPSTGVAAMLGFVSAYALIRGVSDVVLSVQLHHMSGEVKESFRSLTRGPRAAQG